MPVTLGDVARRAGVSRSAVSRVLNNKMERPYAPETVERIRRAAHELNYVPNRLARALVTRRTLMIGFYTPTMTDPHVAALLDMIEIEARRRGYHVLVSTHFESIARAVHVDGLLALQPPAAVDRPPECPVVYVYPSDERLPNTIGWSDGQGAREAARYLASLGHRKVAGVYGIRRGDKGAGFRAGAEASGLALSEYEDVQPGFSAANWAEASAFERQSGYHLTQQLLRKHPGTTAVFARNDIIAAGVLQALREAGIPVPARMSVMGYLNIVTAATSLLPTLTSVRTPIAEAGAIAVNRLIDAIEGGDHQFPGIHLPTSLVVRESTGPAPEKGVS